MKLEDVIKAINHGGLFAECDSIEDAFAYVDLIASATGADEAPVRVAVAVLCNTIAQALRECEENRVVRVNTSEREV